VAVDQGIVVRLDPSILLVACILRLEIILAEFVGNTKGLGATGIVFRLEIDEV